MSAKYWEKNRLKGTGIKNVQFKKSKQDCQKNTKIGNIAEVILIYIPSETLITLIVCNKSLSLDSNILHYHHYYVYCFDKAE